MYLYIGCIQCGYIYILQYLYHTVSIHIWIYLHRLSESTSIALQYGIYTSVQPTKRGTCVKMEKATVVGLCSRQYIGIEHATKFSRSKYNNHEIDYDLIVLLAVRMNDGSKYSASTNIHLKCLEMSASVFSRWVDESCVFIICMSLDTMVLTSLSKNVVYIGIPYIPKPRCFPPVEKKGQEIGVASVLNSLLDQFVSVICKRSGFQYAIKIKSRSKPLPSDTLQPVPARCELEI